jgi:hypothetical protein
VKPASLERDTSVVATGTGSLTYQWNKGLQSIPGATGPSYTTDPLNGLMTLFPAATGWQINNGVAFTTDTLVSIADDGATGYLVIAQK